MDYYYFPSRKSCLGNLLSNFLRSPTISHRFDDFKFTVHFLSAEPLSQCSMLTYTGLKAEEFIPDHIPLLHHGNTDQRYFVEPDPKFEKEVKITTSTHHAWCSLELLELSWIYYNMQTQKPEAKEVPGEAKEVHYHMEASSDPFDTQDSDDGESWNLYLFTDVISYLFMKNHCLRWSCRWRRPRSIFRFAR